MRNIIFLLILGVCSSGLKAVNSFTEEDINIKLEKIVLDESLLGKTYSFKELSSDGILEYKVSYIGDNHNDKDGCLRFIFISSYSGLYEDSKKCISRIVVYKRNSRYGEYTVGGHYDITPIVENSKIIITPNNYGNCDQVTILDIEKELPNEIFIHCKKVNDQMSGDVYYLKKDN